MPIAPPMRNPRQDLINAIAQWHPSAGTAADFLLPGSLDDPTLGMLPMAGMVRGAGGPLRGPFQKALPLMDNLTMERLSRRQRTKDIAAMRSGIERAKAMLADMDSSEMTIRNMLERYRQLRGGE